MSESAPPPKLEPYVRLPRRLARLLEDGETTPTQFGILNYLCEAGADRDGVATTYNALASLFGVSEKTVTRALARLRELELIDYTLGRGQRTPFRIRLGHRTAVRTLEGGSVSDRVSEVTSDVGKPVSDVDDPLEHAWEDEIPPPWTSDRPEVESDHTETETEKETSEKSRGIGRSDNLLPLFENDHLVYKLMHHIAEHADTGKNGGPPTRLLVQRLVAQLPEADIVPIIEALKRPNNIRNRAAWTVATLGAKVDERRAA